MQLTSFTFFFAFLPVSLFLLLLLRKKLPGQNAAPLILSVLFCAASGLAGFVAGLLETLAVYAFARLLARNKSPKARKTVFTLGVLFCVGLLCYFKYTNFLLGALSLPTVSLLPAPVGVSFLTFLLISYLADVYRGYIPAERRFDRFLLYAFFFPKAALHDGAMIISKKRIKAAGCILPVSHSMDIPKELGLRHRAAKGISQETDALAVIVSEETGNISVAYKDTFHLRLSAEELERFLTEDRL